MVKLARRHLNMFNGSREDKAVLSPASQTPFRCQQLLFYGCEAAHRQSICHPFLLGPPCSMTRVKTSQGADASPRKAGFCVFGQWNRSGRKAVQQTNPSFGLVSRGAVYCANGPTLRLSTAATLRTSHSQFIDSASSQSLAS